MRRNLPLFDVGRQDAGTLALQFVILAKAPGEELFGKSSFVLEEFAGVIALELLVNTEPPRLKSLSAEHWAKWIPEILA